MAVIMYGMDEPKASCINLDRIAIGIVISPANLMGVMNKRIPIKDGMMNFRIDGSV